MIKEKNKKVVVAISGGVDSSVSSALLIRAGFNCLGVYMKLGKKNKTAENRARKVALALKIPFKVVNFEKEFKKKVIDYFIIEYGAGRTPNPCVVCNKEIKFGLLMDWAIKQRYDFLSTGHYARIKKNKDRVFQLLKAKDKNKDQTYFLWRLNQKKLAKVLLPIGEIENKAEVRKLAKQFGLSTYNTEESNDVCFLKDTGIYNFLEKKIRGVEGDIVDLKNKKLGKHNGLWRYTIGQRKGILLSGGPYFVVSKNLKKNNLIVSKNEKDLFSKELVALKVNWLSGKEPRLPFKVKTKIRYQSDFADALITKKIAKAKYKVVFSKPQKAITSGQSVVFYLGEELLGGGIIE